MKRRYITLLLIGVAFVVGALTRAYVRYLKSPAALMAQPSSSNTASANLSNALGTKDETLNSSRQKLYCDIEQMAIYVSSQASSRHDKDSLGLRLKTLALAMADKGYALATSSDPQKADRYTMYRQVDPNVYLDYSEAQGTQDFYAQRFNSMLHSLMGTGPWTPPAGATLTGSNVEQLLTQLQREFPSPLFRSPLPNMVT